MQTPKVVARTYQPKDQSSIEWLPLWRIIEMNRSRYDIQVTKVNFLKHAWHLREQNFHYKNEFCLARIGFLKSGLSKFDVDHYWQNSVYRRVKTKYFEHYATSQLSSDQLKDVKLKKFIDETYIALLDGFEVANLSSYLYNDFIFSSSYADFLQLVREKTIQGFNMFLLCYDYGLIESSPSKWNEILKMYVESFSKCGNIQSEEKTVGILVDYDLHEHLSACNVFKDFFKQYFLVYNIFSDEYLMINKNYSEHCEKITKDFIESISKFFFS